MKTYLTTDCGIVTTTDLLGYLAEGPFETEIKEVLVGKFAVSEHLTVEAQRLYVSRLRAAYKLGVDTDKRIRAEAEKPPSAQGRGQLGSRASVGPGFDRPP